MRIIEPKAELWDQSECETWQEHVARCARVCYGHEGNTDNAEKFVAGLRKRGHNSMLRHATRYFVVDTTTTELSSWRSPYIMLSNCTKDGLALASCNIQFCDENIDVPFGLKYESEISDGQLLELSKKDSELFMLYRLTFCLTTQISTSRELNRVSPNNIAERSTRYCVEKDLEICRPWWYSNIKEDRKEVCKRSCAESGWTCAELMYKDMLDWGAKPEDARGVLPLDTATKVVYTYSVAEWMNIIRNRYYEKTGKAHPNAKLIIGMVREKINAFAEEHGISVRL